jgi:ribosomal protein S18 acetylase RimI-like enzyme
MEQFQLDTAAGRNYALAITEVTKATAELVRTLVEIDLQTFSESTFSHYAAACLLEQGRVMLLSVDELVIGTCVCMRTWDRPNEIQVLSMGIRPGWRGRGLGQRFIGGVLKRLRQHGHHAVVLMVGGDNKRAIKVYEDVGFVAVGKGPGDPRTGEELIRMRCQLQDGGVVIEIT